MAFAVPAAINTSETTTNTTTHTVALPASISAGQLLIIAISFSANVNATLPGTWTAELVDNGDSGTSTGLWIAWKFASGSEGASVNVTSSGSCQSAHASARFTGMHASAAPEAGTVTVTVNSTTHNPTSLTPSWGSADTLFMALVGWRNAARTISSYPTNYTDNQTSKNNSGGGNQGAIAFATRNVTGTSDDPGSFTLNAASGGQCITLAIRPGSTSSTLAVDSVSFAHTPTTVTLKYNRKLAVASASFAHTPTAVTLKYNRKLAVASTSFAFTPSTVALKFGRKLAVSSVSFAFTPAAVGLRHNYKLAIGSASFAFTPTDVTLRRSVYRLPVGAVSFAFTPTAVTLKHGWRLNVASVSFAATFADVGLLYSGANPSLNVETVSFAFTPAAVGLRYNRKIGIDAVSFLASFQDISLLRGRRLAVDGISFGATFDDIDLSVGAAPSPPALEVPGGSSRREKERAIAARKAWERATKKAEAEWRAQKEREALEALAMRFEKEGITPESLLGVDPQQLILDDDEDVIEILLLNL